MKQNKAIIKNCILGAGLTLLGFILPLLKFYAFAPQQFLQAFKLLS